MNIWLPETMDPEAHRHAMDVMAARFITDSHPLGEKLREIDPYLDLVKVARPIGWEQGAPFGMKFGHWHLLRRNPDAPDSYVPIQGPDGEYVEPVSELVDWVRRQDQWDRRVQAANEQAQKAEQSRRLHERREVLGEAHDEIATRVKLMNNGPGVRVSRKVA